MAEWLARVGAVKHRAIRNTSNNALRKRISRRNGETSKALIGINGVSIMLAVCFSADFTAVVTWPPSAACRMKAAALRLRNVGKMQRKRKQHQRLASCTVLVTLPS